MRPQAANYLVELKVFRDRLKVMETNVSAEMLKRWFDNGPALVPARRLALLCGHPRSGTTLLEQVLDSHPDIVSAEETDIFVDDAFPLLRRNFPPEAYMLPVLEAAPSRRCSRRVRPISAPWNWSSAVPSPAGCCSTKIPFSLF